MEKTDTFSFELIAPKYNCVYNSPFIYPTTTNTIYNKNTKRNSHTFNNSN